MPDYTQVKVSVAPEIAAEFKARCVSAGVSMAGELSSFMSLHKCTPKKPSTKTRQLRRKVLKSLIQQLEEILHAEQQYLDNIPANLQNSQVYEAAELTVTALEEALNILNEAY